jgi:ribonuclease HI
MNGIERLLMELAAGTALDEAWETAGFASRAEAERALHELAASLRGETVAARPAPSARRTIGEEDGLGLIVYVDGASRGNPGPASIAAIARLETGEELTSVSKRIGRATNNVAEYRAVIEGLKLAKDLGAARVEMRLDSELVVKQLKGEYRIKNTELQILAEAAVDEARRFSVCTYVHIPRSENGEADRLANTALDKAGGEKGS